MNLEAVKYLVRGFFLSFLLFLLIGCGARPGTGYSIYGVDSTTDYPAVVIVAMRDGGFCSGTFIGPSVILTAAHCVKEGKQHQIETAFGSFSSDDVIVGGPGVEEDPSDIALLILKESAADPFLGQVLTVGGPLRKGSEVRLVGFGENVYPTGGGAGAKRTGTNIVASLGEYLEIETPLSVAKKRTDSRGARGFVETPLLLGPRDRAGAGSGDSGGPALLNVNGTLTVVGVSHAHYEDGNLVVSQYVSVNRNMPFLIKAATERNLDIRFFR